MSDDRVLKPRRKSERFCPSRRAIPASAASNITIVIRQRLTFSAAVLMGICFCSHLITPADAQVYGPDFPEGRSPGGPSPAASSDWWSSTRTQSLGGPAYQSFPTHPSSNHPDDPDTIERVSGEDKGPRIPEPMVFDLVRPLGANRGEAEVNSLGLVPLKRKTGRVDDATDPLGIVRRSPDTQGIEWAPEIEYTVVDGVALEFELPLENSRLEAYKAAGQVTFGTGFNRRYIHGAQAIVQYDRQPQVWTSTWLYLAGFRFDDTWSVFGMFGPRFEHGSPVGGRNVEMLSNVTLFADITNRLVAGIETNWGQVLGGSTAVLVMPQVHYEIGRYWMIQAGIGARVTTDLTLPEAGFRLIREF